MFLECSFFWHVKMHAGSFFYWKHRSHWLTSSVIRSSLSTVYKMKNISVFPSQARGFRSTKPRHVWILRRSTDCYFGSPWMKLNASFESCFFFIQPPEQSHSAGRWDRGCREWSWDWRKEQRKEGRWMRDNRGDNLTMTQNDWGFTARHNYCHLFYVFICWINQIVLNLWEDWVQQHHLMHKS